VSVILEAVTLLLALVDESAAIAETAARVKRIIQQAIGGKLTDEQVRAELAAIRHSRSISAAEQAALNDALGHR
jgi:hypothetical protein